MDASNLQPKLIRYIGQDKFGNEMKEDANFGNANVQHYKDESTPEGTRAFCIREGEGSLVAKFSVVNCYNLNKPEMRH